MDQLVKERSLNTDLPPLPPFLRKKGPERRRVFIIPNLMMLERHYDSYLIHDRQNNWITTVYQWMHRVSGESIFDPDAKWENANINTRRYRQWLETYETNDGIPPHISFGGAIESGTGDPTFYSRWVNYARETFY